MANPSAPSRSGSIANGPPSAGVNASQPTTSGIPATQNLNQIVSWSSACILQPIATFNGGPCMVVSRTPSVALHTSLRNPY
jgi:hypothetical protein